MLYGSVNYLLLVGNFVPDYLNLSLLHQLRLTLTAEWDINAMFCHHNSLYNSLNSKLFIHSHSKLRELLEMMYESVCDPSHESLFINHNLVTEASAMSICIFVSSITHYASEWSFLDEKNIKSSNHTSGQLQYLIFIASQEIIHSSSAKCFVQRCLQKNHKSSCNYKC